MARGISARIDASRFDAAFSEYYRFAEQRAERAALIATDRGRTIALNRLRGDMQAAGLGGLGRAISSTSDLSRGQPVHRLPNGGFSASGGLFIRTRSERTVGAIEAYTKGAAIRPRKGRWLWFPTENIQRFVGSRANRQRLTPALWEKSGLDRRVGPLTLIRSVNGYPLLVVKNVGVAMSGQKRSARSLTKSGRARKGQVAREMVVAFIGIPFTSRQARVDVTAIMREVQQQLPQMFLDALGRI